MNPVTEILEWMKTGKIGCTFASYFARCPETIGWKFVIDPVFFKVPQDCLMLSLVFPQWDKELVKLWAMNNGFFLEKVEDGLTGLRFKFPEGIAWVQYFGPDADVITRQAPHPMLMMSVKMPAKYYAKVGFKGILHIAHASVASISNYVADRLWDSAHTNTTRQLGHKATIREAAKVTYHE